jgi:uncharacterized surface protein with fasciclin (FAS1) repeats
MTKYSTIMKFNPIKLPAALLLLLAVSVASCTDVLDDYYQTGVNLKGTKNLYEFIQSQEDLSLFAEMLQETGYDTILSENQVYTVWAPTNDALLKYLNLEDDNSLMNLVQNHIARYAYPVQKADSQAISMLSKKIFTFSNLAGTPMMGSSILLKHDSVAFNGIVHVLDNELAYNQSHWEFLMNNQETGLDSVSNYIRSLNKEELDVEKSYVDEVLVDSIMKTTNKALTYLGALDLEDSIYTTILPDNDAWNQAYATTSSYFKTPEIDGGAAVQRANSLWIMMSDQVFRGRIAPPIADTILWATNGNGFLKPDTLFEGATRIDMSNGYAYRTSSLKKLPSQSFLGPIRMEAEYSSGREAGNYSLSTNSCLGTQFSTSNQYYVTALPTSNTSISKLFLKYPIPNVLSTKYNVYVVFVPTCIVDTSDKRPYKLNYYLTYTKADGTTVKDAKLTSPVNMSNPAVVSNVTNPTGMTVVKVLENFEFPFCNLIYSNTLTTSEASQKALSIARMATSTTWLKIENATGTSTTETKNYNRTIRVDCVIFEPVQ